MPVRKFTPALGDEVVAYIRAGNYYQTAAKAAGIHKSTLYTWIQTGDEGDDPELAEFAEKVWEADALAEIDAVAKVREAKQGWQAHMTFLERRHSDRWSRAERAGQGPRERAEKAEDVFKRLQADEAEGHGRQPHPLQAVGD